MRCAICGKPGHVAPFFVGGRDLLGNYIGGEKSIGDVCGDECGTLLWASYFERTADAPPHERTVTAWRIRKRMAEAQGRPFTEKPPKSPIELELETVIETREWSDVAREVS